MAICPTCREEFQPRSNQKYCRPAHRKSARLADRWVILPEGRGDLAEVMRLLWAAARLGSVPAMLVLLKQSKGESVRLPKTAIDELAKRRGGRKP